jgi:adenosylmethionine-8-amino-7-oxononanoate aminotransferase
VSAPDWLALDRRHVWHPYTPVDDPRPPLAIVRAQGARFWDADGKSYLDGNSSWWVAGLGHGHPRVVAALAAQARTMCHVSLAGIAHEPAARLAAELVQVAPPGLDRVFFSDDGSTAIEAAIKLAVQWQAQRGRPDKRRLVALGDAFHGETAGCASLGGVELFRRASGPLLFDAFHLPAPAPGAPCDEPEIAAARAFAAARVLVESHADELAACVVEPVVQGASGMRMYAPALLADLAALCRAHDVLLIVDEVFTGYARTGPMWAVEHAGVTPDLMCLGKTFSGGVLPMAATLVHERLADAFRGDRARAFLHGHSFCGNPLGAAVAREVLAIMRDEDVVAQVARKAPRLRQAVDEAARLTGGRRPRALGMIAAFDLPGGAGYLGERGWRAYDAGLARGAYLRPLGDTLYLAPPLTIADDELDELCTSFVAAARAAV